MWNNAPQDSNIWVKSHSASPQQKNENELLNAVRAGGMLKLRCALSISSISYKCALASKHYSHTLHHADL